MQFKTSLFPISLPLPPSTNVVPNNYLTCQMPFWGLVVGGVVLGLGHLCTQAHVALEAPRMGGEFGHFSLVNLSYVELIVRPAKRN